MKRVTISIDNDIYSSLMEYARETSKQDISPVSVSRTIRQLITNELTRLNYYPMTQKKKEELQLRSLIQERRTKEVNEGKDTFLLMMQKREEIVAK